MRLVAENIIRLFAVVGASYFPERHADSDGRVHDVVPTSPDGPC